MLLVVLLLLISSWTTLSDAEEHTFEYYSPHLAPTGAFQANSYICKSTVYKPIAKAIPDECYFGLDSTNEYPIDPSEYQACLDQGGKLKTNEAYPWAMTVAKDNIFIGTVTNALCEYITSVLRQPDFTLETDHFLCGGAAEDHKPPGMYLLKQTTNAHPTTTVQSASVVATGWSITDLSDALPSAAKALLAGSIGIRGAGNHEGVVFFGAPDRTANAINFFAFDAQTTNFLGAFQSTIGSDIRKWYVSSKTLFFGVGAQNGLASGSPGAVYKWIGKLKYKSFATCKAPCDVSSKVNQAFLWKFEAVGEGLDGLVAELVKHDNRLFVHTWPSRTTVASIWASPKGVSIGSLSSKDTGNWELMFTYASYEPNVFALTTYAGGALASWMGKLYFGTINPAVLSYLVYMRSSAPKTTLTDAQAPLYTWRATQIFRATFDSTGHNIELLYGGTFLSKIDGEAIPLGSLTVYDPSVPEFRFAPNLLGLTPIFGPSGFGWPFNSYTWSMGIIGDELYIGTFDSSIALADIGAYLLDTAFPPLDPLLQNILDSDILDFFGGDLWKSCDANLPFVPVTLSGFENKWTYGVRNINKYDKGLILGLTNPFSLADGGGWEITQIKSFDNEF